MQQFQVGEALSKTFSIFFKSFPKLIGLAVLIYSPYIAVQILMPGGEDPLTGLQTDHPLATFLSFFLGPMLTAAATFEVLQRMRGQTAAFSDCLSVGFGRLFPVLFVNILMSLAIGVGMVLLVIPGIILAVMLCVSIPVCVVERPGIIASLNRSSELTKGNRWGIFATLLVFIVLVFLLVVVLMVVIFAGAGSEFGILVMVVTIALTLVMSTLQAVMMATIYHELRTKKEGAASDDLVEVFA